MVEMFTKKNLHVHRVATLDMKKTFTDPNRLGTAPTTYVRNY